MKPVGFQALHGTMSTFCKVWITNSLRAEPPEMKTEPTVLSFWF